MGFPIESINRWEGRDYLGLCPSCVDVIYGCVHAGVVVELVLVLELVELLVDVLVLVEVDELVEVLLDVLELLEVLVEVVVAIMSARPLQLAV